MEKKDKISVLLVEDHTIVRKGIISLLTAEPEIQIVGEASNGIEALEKINKLMPEVVVMDIGLPLLNGLEVTRQITKRFPEIKILILSKHEADEVVLSALNSGAKGYLHKTAAPEQLVTAIQTLYKGNSYFSPEISKIILNKITGNGHIYKKTDKLNTLTTREREVLQLVAEGHSSREIAELLFLSVKTIENHRSNMMKKLNLHNITDLIRFAISKGIIQA